MSQYKSTLARIKEGRHLPPWALSGKFSKEFRSAFANVVSRKNDPQMLTKILKLDSESVKHLDMDKIRRISFLLNSTDINSITNLIVNMRLQGYYFAGKEDNVPENMRHAKYELKFYKRYAPLHTEELVNDINPAILAVYAQQLSLSYDEEQNFSLHKESGMAVTELSNSLSWMLNITENTEGKQYGLNYLPLEGPELFRPVAGFIANESLELDLTLQAYRQRIQGRIASWEANFISSFDSIRKALDTNIKLFNKIIEPSPIQVEFNNQMLSMHTALENIQKGITGSNCTYTYAESLMTQHETLLEYARLNRHALSNNEQNIRFEKIPRFKKLGSSHPTEDNISEQIENTLADFQALHAIELPKTKELIAFAPTCKVDDHKSRVRKHIQGLIDLSAKNAYVDSITLKVIKKLIAPTFHCCIPSLIGNGKFSKNCLHQKNKQNKGTAERQKGFIYKSYNDIRVSDHIEIQPLMEFSALRLLEQQVESLYAKLKSQLDIATTELISYVQLLNRVVAWKIDLSLAILTEISEPNTALNIDLELKLQLEQVRKEGFNWLKLFRDFQAKMIYFTGCVIKQQYSLFSGDGETERRMHLILKKDANPLKVATILRKIVKSQQAELDPQILKLLECIPDNPLAEILPALMNITEVSSSDLELLNVKLNLNKKDHIKITLLKSLQKYARSQLYKLPHDIVWDLVDKGCAVVNNTTFARIQAPSKNKQAIAEILSSLENVDKNKQKKLSDGTWMIATTRSVKFYIDVDGLKINLDDNFKIESKYHLPVSVAFSYQDQLREAMALHTYKNMLAIDLNANGIGWCVFQHTKPQGSEGREYDDFVYNENTSPSGFIKIPQLSLLSDRVTTYRKVESKARTLGKVIDPQLEALRKFVTSRVLKEIQNLQIRYKIGYFALENEVSGLESGERRLKALYGTIQSYFFAKNDAQRTKLARYWGVSTRGTIGAGDLTGKNGGILKWKPSVLVTASGTSQQCHECGTNMMLEVRTAFDSLEVSVKAMPGCKEVHIQAGQQSYVLDIRDDKDIATLSAHTDYAEVRKVLKKYLRKDSKQQHRSTQSLFNCNNPTCSKFHIDQDADVNAAINIGNRAVVLLEATPFDINFKKLKGLVKQVAGPKATVSFEEAEESLNPNVEGLYLVKIPMETSAELDVRGLVRDFISEKGMPKGNIKIEYLEPAVKKVKTSTKKSKASD